MNPGKCSLQARGHRRSAITLLEVICVVMVVGFTLGLVTEVFVTQLDVNRRLTASASRAATANSLTHRLRSDLLAASSISVSNRDTDAREAMTIVALDGSAGRTTYSFHRIDRRKVDAERDPAIDQVIVRNNAVGEEHRWTLQAQTVDVEASPAAPSRILLLKFKQNGRSSPGFNRRENSEVSLLTGGEP